MARRGGMGGKAVNDNMLALAAGAVGAAIVDFTWNSIRGFGYNLPVAWIATPGNQGDIEKWVPITLADQFQLGGAAFANIAGLAAGGATRLPAFATGILMAQVVMKFLLPSFGLGRYLLFKINSSGALEPVGRF